MSEMTKQHMFDMAWTGLKEQGFERSVEGGSCKYRSYGGLKCAIGHCLSDEDYNPEWEGSSGDFVSVRLGWGLGSFANKLQQIHDFAYTPEEMQHNLRTFANTHSLTIPGEPA